MHYTTKFNFGRNKLFCHGWCRKEQKLERRSWSDLPLDIINLIADRLYYVYQIRFQAVCKSREAADIVQYGDKLPWLMGTMHTHVISTILLTNKNTLFSIVPETEQFLLVQHHLIQKMIGSFSREIIKFSGGEKRSFTLFLHTFHLKRSINFLYCASTGFTKQTSQRLQFLQTCVVFAISLESNKYIINICRLEDITWN